MLNVVLFEPEIPANTGNIGRTCVVTGSRLHLVGRLGFSLDDHSLKRAGLGFWDSVDVVFYASWEDFLEANALVGSGTEPKLHLLTKKARRLYTEATYSDGDFLVFGKESCGLPEEILAALPGSCERIPMLPDAVSLKNANSWPRPHGNKPTGSSPILEQDVCGNFIDPEDFRVSALNLSNAAAIVLFEALRQMGFAGM